MNFSDPTKFPDFQYLTDLVGEPTAMPGMIWEEKMDGVRAMVSISALRLRSIVLPKHQLLLRSGQQIPRGCLLDGEIMATDGNFTAVQGRITRGQWRRLEFVPFDCLYWDGKSLRNEPLITRRKRLLMIDPGPQILETVDGVLPKVPMAWEGVVGKMLLGPYLAGKRKQWVKWKQTGLIKVRILRFEEGEGSWAGLVGKVVFGAYINGTPIELGVAAVPTAIDRWEFQHHGEKYIGKACYIRHYGIVKVKFRNPIYEGLADG